MIAFELIKDFVNLFFPRNCSACGKSLLKNEEVICTQCLYHLPRTNYHLQKENPISQLFWGKANIENATAFYFFNKGSIFQKLIHKLKYQGQQDIGIALGSYLGSAMLDSPLYKDIDVIIPVPLHLKRQKKRGYNQSECIAKGIAKHLPSIVDTKSLYRTKATETQTKKSRMERWENVDSIFAVRKNHNLSNKHILLVDDVITTGATLEACAESLLKIENVKVSIAAIAVAH